MVIDLLETYAAEESKCANWRGYGDHRRGDCLSRSQRSACQQELLRDHPGAERDGIERHTRATCGLQAMCCRARFGITVRMQTSFWSRTRTSCGCRIKVKSLRRTRSRTMRRLWQSALTDAMASFTRRSFRRSARPSMLPHRVQSRERRRRRARRLQWLPPLWVNTDLSCSWCRLPLRGRLFILPTA